MGLAPSVAKGDVNYIFAIISIITCCIITFVYVPYCLWIFYKDRNEMYAKKRRPVLVIALILTNVVIQFYWAIFRIDGYCLFEFCLNQPPIFTTLYINVTVGTMTTILAARVWLLFYDLKHGEAILKHEWWTTISDEKDWFIRNKPRWGSFRNFLWKPILIILILLYSITIILGNVLPESSAIRASLGMLALINTWWILLIILFCKMPKEYDTLLIRKEINRLVIYYAISTIWYSVSLQTINKTYPLFIHWFNSFYTYSFTAIISAMVTLWPHYEKSLQVKRRTSSTTEPSLSSETNSRDISSFATTWTVYVNQATDDKNWNKFMRHLIKEFAVENLCFLLEAIQFKSQLIQDSDKLFSKNKVYINNDSIGWFVKLPQGLPQSSIIEHSNGNYIEQIKKIHSKYVSQDALLAINISFEARSKFMQDMDSIINSAQDSSEKQIELVEIDSNPASTDIPNLEKSVANSNNEAVLNILNNTMYIKILKLFDGALHDIHTNLNGSFHRFVLNQGLLDEDEEIIDAIIRTTKHRK